MKYADGILTFQYGEKMSLGEDEYWLNEGTNDPDWLEKMNDVTQVVFNESFAYARPTSCYKWFYNSRIFPKLKVIEGIEYLNTSNATNMCCMFYNCSLTSLDLSNFNTSNVTDMSYMFDKCCNLTSLDLSNFDTSNVTDMYNMFNNCQSLTSLNLFNFNTSNVTNMEDMFSGCSCLTSLNLSNFNTSNVTNMRHMFSGCQSLTSLNLSNFNTSNVADMSYMFDNCHCLQSLDLFNFNTSKATYMYNMFSFCTNLTSLDLSNFDTSNITDMSYIFAACWELTTIYASDKFVLTSVTNDNYMFAGCKKLVGAIAFDANNVDKTYATIYGGYFTDKQYTRPWVKYADGTLTFQYGYKKTLDNEEYPMNEGWDKPEWYSKNTQVTKVVFDNSFAYTRPTSCYYWFTDCENLTDIEGIENLNTSECTVMNSMFYRCKKLTSLDLSNFDTRKVTNLNTMFHSCINLKNIYVSEKFVTAPTVSNFIPSSTVFYCIPSLYNTTKANAVFAAYTLKPYVPINSKAEYGTLCVPLGSTLAESSYSGFDKLYTIKSADKDKGTITMEKATTIEPGVAYVYRRNLPEDATESIITFDADMDASSAVTAPKNEGSLLKGTFSRITAPGGCYILQTDGNFHPVSSDNTTLGVGAYRAYLDLSTIDIDGGYAKNYKMVFEDNQTTAIDGVSEQTGSQPKTYFDLMGRRVSTPKAGGIYIQNGKKVIYNN